MLPGTSLVRRQRRNRDCAARKVSRADELPGPTALRISVYNVSNGAPSRALVLNHGETSD